MGRCHLLGTPESLSPSRSRRTAADPDGGGPPGGTCARYSACCAAVPAGCATGVDGAPTHRANVWQGTFPKVNSALDGHAATASVFAYGPQNELGLYNMIGNVWEWVEDYWQVEHARTPKGAPPHIHIRLTNNNN